MDDDGRRDPAEDQPELRAAPSDPDPAPGPGAEPEPGEPEPPVQYRMRRAPRYRSFGLTGVVAGVVIGLILALSQPTDGTYSQRTIAGYFAASFALLGAMAGRGAAVLAERRRR